MLENSTCLDNEDPTRQEYVSLRDLAKQFDTWPACTALWVKSAGIPKVKLPLGPKKHKWIFCIHKKYIPEYAYYMNGEGGIKAEGTNKTEESGYVPICEVARHHGINPNIVQCFLRKHSIGTVQKRAGKFGKWTKHISRDDAKKFSEYWSSLIPLAFGMTAKQLMLKYQCACQAAYGFINANSSKCGTAQVAVRIKPKMVLNEYLPDFERYLREEYRDSRHIDEDAYFYLVLFYGNTIKTGTSRNPQKRCHQYRVAIPSSYLIFSAPCRRGDEDRARTHIMEGEIQVVKGRESGREIFNVKSISETLAKAHNYFNGSSAIAPPISPMNEKSRYAGVIRGATYDVTWNARLMVNGHYIQVATGFATEEEAAIEYDYHLRRSGPDAEFVIGQPYRKGQVKINFPEYDFSTFKPQKEIDYQTGKVLYGTEKFVAPRYRSNLQSS